MHSVSNVVFFFFCCRFDRVECLLFFLLSCVSCNRVLKKSISKMVNCAENAYDMRSGVIFFSFMPNSCCVKLRNKLCGMKKKEETIRSGGLTTQIRPTICFFSLTPTEKRRQKNVSNDIRAFLSKRAIPISIDLIAKQKFIFKTNYDSYFAFGHFSSGFLFFLQA